MATKASFIIPTRGRAEILKISLPLMLSQVAEHTFEIVVVSDASRDGTDDVVRSIESERLQFAELEVPSGPAAARNRAIDMARGEILVFVDDDSLIKSDFLEEHLKHHDGTDDRTVVTGPIIDVHQVPDFQNLPKAGLFSRHWNAFPTCNASVRKRLVTEAGGFDEAFRTYGWEDPEMYVRLARNGVRPTFSHSAPIYHYKPRAITAPLEERLALERMRGANGALFYAKHPTFGVGLQTKQLGVFSVLDRLANRYLDLQGKVEATMTNGYEPTSGLVRTMMILHAEIEAGRRAKSTNQSVDQGL
ncbi:MAG: glycosyltransferase family 2 protein [Alphaproteobacteria bacterium]|nr:glycosyltransferase family 2 protein [Alphaproteobacteria bacterium]